MKRLIILLPIVLVLLISISTANAQHTNDPAAPQSGYDQSWYTIDGGGATFITGGSYSLGGVGAIVSASGRFHGNIRV